MITLNSLSKIYRTDEIETVALENVNLTVERGEFLSIMGPSGCGKSTLVSLISRFYDVTCGTVKLNGRNVKELTNQEIHDKVGIVQQRSVLFKGSIRDNMKWGNENASDSEIWDALKVAQAKEVVEGKDGQLDFMLEQNGKNLSGGQRQAITLLMASFQKPKLLLLDEHTAALDPKTAAKVLEISDKIISENHLTAMMVTHNMKDAIVHGNRLIMMHEGKVILNISGEEKKKLTVEDLLHQFEKVSGEEFANDKALLS